MKANNRSNPTILTIPKTISFWFKRWFVLLEQYCACLNFEMMNKFIVLLDFISTIIVTS